MKTGSRAKPSHALLKPKHPWKARAHEVIFEADTRAGRLFDVALLLCIVLSVAAVLLESVPSVRQSYGVWLKTTEWVFTILFTVEYFLRLWCVGRPMAYATSFFGLVDLLAILPNWLSLLLPGAQYMLVIRGLRLLRVFRVLKLIQYLTEANHLLRALRASRRKILVFLLAVLTLVLLFGAVIYLIEGEENGFSSIPLSMYWAIVTLTTVGYGDISPQTWLGQAVASLLMILGYGIIAVPTGIVTFEMARTPEREVSTQACPECAAEGHDPDAVHCKYCGARL